MWFADDPGGIALHAERAAKDVFANHGGFTLLRQTCSAIQLPRPALSQAVGLRQRGPLLSLGLRMLLDCPRRSHRSRASARGKRRSCHRRQRPRAAIDLVRGNGPKDSVICHVGELPRRIHRHRNRASAVRDHITVGLQLAARRIHRIDGSCVVIKVGQ